MKNNATSNPPGTTQTADGCVVEGTVGRLPATCQHGRDVQDHTAARQGSAGHQRTR